MAKAKMLGNFFSPSYSYSYKLQLKRNRTLFEINYIFDAVWSFLKQQTRAADLPIKFWTLVGNTRARKKSVIHRQMLALYAKKIMKSYHKIES